MFEEIPFMPNIDLRGNFQCEKYFANVEDEIRRLFCEPAAIRDELDRYCAQHGLDDFDAIHIQFFSNPATDHGRGPQEPLPEKYFLRAMQSLEGHGPLVVATDNKALLADFLARHGVARRCHVLQFTDSLLDFFLLARASRIAISNSSFSWWASYLGNTKRTVLAPHRYYWFDRKERANPFWNTSTLYPDKFEELIF